MKQKDKQMISQLEKKLKAEQEARAFVEKQLMEEKKRKKLEEATAARAVAFAAATRYFCSTQEASSAPENYWNVAVATEMCFGGIWGGTSHSSVLYLIFFKYFFFKAVFVLRGLFVLRQWEDWEILHEAESQYSYTFHLQDVKDEYALNYLLYLDCAKREMLYPAWVSLL